MAQILADGMSFFFFGHGIDKFCSHICFALKFNSELNSDFNSDFYSDFPDPRILQRGCAGAL
jgi:hypothetical protein